MQKLIADLQQSIMLLQSLLHAALETDRSDLSSVRKGICAEWLAECTKELCRMDGAFDVAFIVKYLQRVVSEYEEWLIEFLPTEKMLVPSMPLLLRHFDYAGDTEKTVALKKIALKKVGEAREA